MTTTDTAVEFSREEIVALLDTAAKEIGMTTPEMLCQFRRGVLKNASEVLDVLALAEILPESDPLRRCER